MRKVSKFFGALLGGVTPASIVGYLAAFGVHLPEAQIGVILTLATLVASALGVYVAPKNEDAQASEKPVAVPTSIQPPYPSSK